MVIDGLRNGDNYILWPSGRIQHAGIERLGGARALADILQAVPQASVVLVRTRGLWGSMFSYAQTGEHPNLIGRYAAGLGYLMSNLLVFMPRRPVSITIERIERSRLPELRREKLNPWFEAWYNTGGSSRDADLLPLPFRLWPAYLRVPQVGESRRSRSRPA